MAYAMKASTGDWKTTPVNPERSEVAIPADLRGRRRDGPNRKWVQIYPAILTTVNAPILRSNACPNIGPQTLCPSHAPSYCIEMNDLVSIGTNTIIM